MSCTVSLTSASTWVGTSPAIRRGRSAGGGWRRRRHLPSSTVCSTSSTRRRRCRLAPSICRVAICTDRSPSPCRRAGSTVATTPRPRALPLTSSPPAADSTSGEGGAEGVGHRSLARTVDVDDDVDRLRRDQQLVTAQHAIAEGEAGRADAVGGDLDDGLVAEPCAAAPVELGVDELHVPAIAHRVVVRETELREEKTHCGVEPCEVPHVEHDALQVDLEELHAHAVLERHRRRLGRSESTPLARDGTWL